MAQERDEIDEIMNEIKTLQDSISSVQTPSAEVTPAHEAKDAPNLTLVPTAEDDLSGLRAASTSSDEPSLEETMARMKADPEVKTLLDEPTSSIESDDYALAEVIDELSEHESQDTGSETDGSLSMTLTGKMALKLKYAFGSHEVQLRFKDDSLQITMSDGTEIKVPMKANRARGKAA